MNPALLAARYFLPTQDIADIKPFGTGNVNDTYLVTSPQGEEFVLQRINPDVFPDPQHVQDNMRVIGDHLTNQLRHSSERAHPFIPIVLHTGQKGDTYLAEDGGVWRLVNRIPGILYETIKRPSQAEELGRCLGFFHRLLSTLNQETLKDTLPGFHHIPAYLKQYDLVREKIRHVAQPKEDLCYQFIDHRRSLALLLENIPELSRGVIHGDPKVANFVFHDKDDTVISLIDLDTVRSGLLLHDIGDALRSCCNTTGENPSSPAETEIDLGLFTAWLKGYANEAELLLTMTDKEHIVEAVRIITFELGLRFFTDHLDGDRYFKTQYQGHNLFRAQVQFHLVQSIEDQFERMLNIVANTMPV